MSNQINNEQLLYETIKSLLAGQEWTANGHDFGEWAETVEALAGTPPDERLQVFQSLDTFHRGELSRLLSTYRPEAAVPAVIDDDEEEEVQDWPDLPAHVQPDPALAAGAAPWLDEYMKFCNYWSPRSYEGYNEACGLWLLSTIAARRLSYYFGDPGYTNLYLMIAGKSGQFVKSGATKLGLRVLRTAGLDWFLTPDDATPQSLISCLMGEVPDDYEDVEPEEQLIYRLAYGFAAQRGWFHEEFGSNLNEIARSTSYMTKFRSLLCIFHDCPDKYKYKTQARKMEKVERPYLTMLANLTPSDMRDVGKRGAQLWRDGSLARFGFIVPPPTAASAKDSFPDGKLIIPDTLVTPLRNWHKRLGLPTVTVGQSKKRKRGGSTRFSLSSPPPVTHYPIEGEVKEMLIAYNLALLDMSADIPEDLVAPYRRFHHKALRVAVLLASIGGHEAVQINHTVRAILIAETWRASLHRLYKQVWEEGQDYSPEADMEDRVLEIIGRRGNPTAAEIHKSLPKYSSVQIGRLADELVKIGVLKATGRMWGGRLVNRYSLPKPIKEETAEPVTGS